MNAKTGQIKATAFLMLLAGYLTFNYPFMQLRIPPTGFGIPLGELLLAVILLSSNVVLATARIGSSVFLLPFLAWWSWGFARLCFDAAEYGFWAFRDSTQLIESLFLIAGFILAGNVGTVERLTRWLPPIIAFCCVYGLLFSFADEITAWSPKLAGASEQPIAIFGSFAVTGTMMIWGATYLMIQPAQTLGLRLRYGLVAGFLVAFALLILQERTTYLQLLSLVALLWVLRPRTLVRMGTALPILMLLLAVISAFDLRISGRLTSNISPDFFWEHIQSIFGIAVGGSGLAEAAGGVSLRMGWWIRLYDLLTADAVTMITGLGYGIPLTDFRDTLGVVTREPHNSVISVVARLGLIGLISWLWMQIELFRAGLRAYFECRRTGRRQSADLVFLLIVFAVLTLASCFGEDTMEKPYYAIPYYAFWGVVIRIAYRLRAQVPRRYPDRAPAMKEIPMRWSA